ncbi:EcsC family protein [uncultured Rhodoblastus sp.]|uniref:EcsC family protein n=1 Tax=uncultured Rhodoblastus sp. TaxID=543037 RepID=UPI0025CC0D4D|nr:EcsC family protein [uncultured Rhodoblastus sp.]
MNIQFDTSKMSPADHAALIDAVQRLEHVGPALRLSRAVGRKLNFAKGFAPERVSKIIDGAALAAMRAALRAAIGSLAGRPMRDRNRSHKIMAAASGAAGGALGLVSLPFELPLTTTVMLRSIADIARAEGENLDDPEAALACLEVFALDGREVGANVAESGYFAVRTLLARSVTEAARYIASRGLIDETAPALIRLLAQLGTRFGLVVSQKMLAQATPAIGAFGGAAINIAFIDHFQSLAKGHFTVRRLERRYGGVYVRDEYQRIAAARIPDEIQPPAA